MFYKFNNVSDFKSIRRCYQVAKELVNCLKYFDTRATRFTCVPQSKAFYDKKRAYSYPEDYLNFQFLETKIALFRRYTFDSVDKSSKFLYFVGITSPHKFVTLGEPFGQFGSVIKDFNLYCQTDLFSEAKDCFLRAVSEFISDWFDSRGLF